MRFCKGAKVEVWSDKEVGLGAWYSAEIISGNGHAYTVKYGWFPMTRNPVVERVPRKVLRPCPPPIGEAKNWVSGDLVEVFHNLSWKTATVLDVVDDNSFLVRLLGLAEELIAHRSRLRIRQCWQDGKWFVVGKGLGDYEMSSGKGESDISTEPRLVSTGKRKRGSPHGSCNFQGRLSFPQKKRVMGKYGGHQRLYSAHPSPTLEKVDTVDYAEEALGNNYVHNSFHVGKGNFFRAGTFGGNHSSTVESSLSMHSDDSCASSVGSCSSMDCNDSASRFSKHIRSMDDCSSDAESSCERDYEKKPCEVGIEGHRSELHVYNSAIGALYESGPLTWEDEENLTNLRHRLHISDDEHLMVKHMGVSKRMLCQNLPLPIWEACIPCF